MRGETEEFLARMCERNGEKKKEPCGKVWKSVKKRKKGVDKGGKMVYSK